MATRFDLTIDPATLTAARATAPQITVVSAERIADELRKLLTHPNRGRGVRLLREIDLVEPILPESGTVWDRLVRVVEALPAETSFPLAFTALLFPVGKPAAESVAARLRLSNAETARVAWLVEKQDALLEAPTLRPSRLKLILVHPGIGDLLALHRAIALAGGGGDGHVAFCERVLRETPREELDPPPLVTGNDLKALGLRPGPEFKRLLDAVREAQLDGTVRTRDDALALVRERLPGPG
jgi:poly(A) polymerase